GTSSPTAAAVADQIPRRPAPPAMAPPSSEEPAAAQSAGAGAISKVLVVIAMQTEALPLVTRFQLVEAAADESIFPKGAPWTRYHGDYKGLHIDLVWPGKDPVLGVDSVGTVSAALVTYASIQLLKPDLIINAGTAGGFKVVFSLYQMFDATVCALQFCSSSVLLRFRPEEQVLGMSS
uniref:Nucleoside phosphorylase domain-containing protein n=1 Tax=Aegilops tauschii subsp. strangulata TaxID=200361 RepID=A0A453QDV6_AEGTS